MKVKDLIKKLQKQDPEQTVYVAVEGFCASNIRVAKAGDRQFSGAPVERPGAVVLMDDGAVEEMGIY